MTSDFYKTTMANIFIGCWPKRCLPNTAGGIAEYAEGLSLVFERFRPETVSLVYDFRTGIVSWSKALPTLGEIENICGLIENRG